MALSKLLFSFDGRIPRSRYWSYVLPFLGVYVVAAFFDGVIGATGYGCATFIVGVVGAFLGWAVFVKRAHDRGHSSAHVLLLSLIPYIGPLWLSIELGLLRGTTAPNRYGPDPLAEEPKGSPSRDGLVAAGSCLLAVVLMVLAIAAVVVPNLARLR